LPVLSLPSPALTLDRVSYDGRITPDTSLVLYPGEVLCLVGKSGAGKSTLLRMAGGLLRPHEGRVLHQAASGPVSIYELPEHALVSQRRRNVGIVAQNARDTLDMAQSAAANIVQPLFDNGERNFGRAMASAQHWFVALDLDVARTGDLPSALSGGMQQRLQIARALVHGPKVLCLDEPTTGLDTSVQVRLLSLLSGLQRQTGVAMLLVTHDLRIARLIAHRVIVIDEGRIVEEAPPDRLIADPCHPAARDLVASMI
jgi:putative phosphonate transport system ATP-binding protein